MCVALIGGMDRLGRKKRHMYAEGLFELFEEYNLKNTKGGSRDA